MFRRIVSTFENGSHIRKLNCCVHPNIKKQFKSNGLFSNIVHDDNKTSHILSQDNKNYAKFKELIRKFNKIPIYDENENCIQIKKDQLTTQCKVLAKNLRIACQKLRKETGILFATQASSDKNSVKNKNKNKKGDKCEPNKKKKANKKDNARKERLRKICNELSKRKKCGHIQNESGKGNKNGPKTPKNEYEQKKEQLKKQCEDLALNDTKDKIAEIKKQCKRLEDEMKEDELKIHCEKKALKEEKSKKEANEKKAEKAQKAKELCQEMAKIRKSERLNEFKKQLEKLTCELKEKDVGKLSKK